MHQYQHSIHHFLLASMGFDYDIPKYVNTSDALQSLSKALDDDSAKAKGCLAATKTGEVQLLTCNASDPDQSWDVVVP